MSDAFEPQLDILPLAQRRLWPELAATPSHFTLYGGTAIALRLGHRQSVDFDFFTEVLFEPRALADSIPYLRGATIRQSAANTLTVTVERDGPVRLSFFGGLRIGQVAEAETVAGPRFNVAALIDLAGMTAAVVTQRAEARDYLDIHALLTIAHIPLSSMLAAATVIYGNEFNPLVSLKAIAYHDDLALAGLSPEARRDLIDAVRATKLEHIPALPSVRRHGIPS
jgi:Nucleotidyl transferase AbiEii toxin, Type IV TA system